MRDIKLRKLSFPIIAMGAVVLAGCAGTAAETPHVPGPEMTVEERAKAAHSMAEEALRKASEASRKADQALGAAHDAQACCQENSEKIDRMFKKAMQK